MATRTHVLSKTYALTEYGNLVGDDWKSFLHDVHSLVRRRWDYGVPLADDERETLRALCHKTLGFENHSYTLAREWLTTKQQEPGSAGATSARVLHRAGWD